jgi:salicylate hydroxylase
MPSKTRVYEKLRFDRVRQCQLAGEDLRNRWHNALEELDDGNEIDPDDIKIKVHPDIVCLQKTFGADFK